jgi:hypothetical protein
MPIRGLEAFKKQSNQTVYSKVSANILHEGILCIDGNWFLKKYTQMVNVHEIFMYDRKERYLDPVLKLVKMAKDCEFEILWVWDGMTYKKPTPVIDTDKCVTEGYKAYIQGDYSGSNRNWKGFIDTATIVADVNELLKGFNVPTMTAPFSATSQMAYFLENNIVGYVFGKSDLLLYEAVEKIISEIFLDRQIVDKQNLFQVEILNKKSICERLEIDLCDFRPLALALGCEICPTLPEYANDFIFENIVTIVKTEGVESYLNKYNTADESSVEDNNKKENDYANIFFTAYVICDCQPVMKEDGRVAPLREDCVPENFEVLFGRRLPNILYERMFLNLISSEILNTLAFETFPDTDADFINLANIAYALIKQKIGLDVSFDGGLVLEKNIKLCDTPNKIEFLNIIAPNIQMDPDLSIVLQILISKNVKYHMLKNPICSKILSYLAKPGLTKQDNEIKFTEDTLRFHLKTIRLRNLLKQCKEAYELVTLTEITLPFRDRYNLFAPGYYEKNKMNSTDPMVKSCENFLNKICSFLRTNFGDSKSIETITNEINMIR